MVNQADVQIKAQMDGKVYEILMLDKEEEELKALLDTRINELKNQADIKMDKLATRRSQLKQELRALFGQVEHKETKTQAKVTLLSGDVIIKKPTRKMECNKGKILMFAKANNLDKYIKIKQTEDFDWLGFKGVLEITDSGIVNTETGELMDDSTGITVVEVPEQVVIK